MELADPPRPVARSSPGFSRETLPDLREISSAGGSAPRHNRAPNPNHQSRLVALDAARVVATFGVLWTHVVEVQGLGTGVAAIGRFGTSFYVIAAVLLAYRTHLSRPARKQREGNITRAKRLLVPYVLWCAIYGLYYGYYAFGRGESFRGLSTWWGPFAGTARHLWFLPFAFASGALVQAVAPKLTNVEPKKLVRWGIGASVCSYAFFYGVIFRVVNHDYIVDFHLHRLDRWIEEIPLVVAALFAAAYFHTPEVRKKWQGKRSEGTFVKIIAALFAFAVATEALYAVSIEEMRAITGAEGRYLANLVGAALLLAFLALGENGVTRRLARFGKYTYFAFLAHILILDSTSMFVGSLPGFGTVPFAIFTCFTLFAVALSFGWIVRRFPPLRWLSP